MSMAEGSKIEITHPHLIICEGADAKYFMIWFINSNELRYEPRFSQDIQVEDFGGIDDLGDYLSMLKEIKGFSKVRSLLIVRDAERDAPTAVSNVRSALSANSLAVPNIPCEWVKGHPSVGFILFPSCSATPINGTLEDLCLEIMKTDEVIQNVDRFIKELQSAGKRTFPRVHKSKIHSYFSVTEPYVSLKIGEAGKAGAYDWSHEKMQRVAGFIKEIF